MQRPATEKLSRLFARTAMPFIFSLGVFGAARGAAPVKMPIDTAHEKILPMASTRDIKLREDDKINAALWDEVQAQYPALLKAARTGYSARLDSVEKAVNGYNAGHHSKVFRKVAVIDPLKLDISFALKKTDSAAVADQFADKNMRMRPGIVQKLSARTHQIIASPYLTPGIGTESATALDNDFKGKQDALILPLGNIAQNVTIGGLNHRQMMLYFMLHESWHARDATPGLLYVDTARWNNRVREITKDLRHHVPVDSLDNPEALKYYAAYNRSEGFADLGALGDMVRRGENPKIIDSVMNWRTTSFEDMGHSTRPMLRRLKSEITAMGVKKFRAMPEDDCVRLYIAIVKNAAMDPKSILFARHYNLVDSVTAARMYRQALHDPQFMKGAKFTERAYIDSYKTTPAVQLDPQIQAGLEDFTDIDAFRMMADTAFAMEGKATPVTIVRAYVHLQGLLETRREQDAGNQIYQEIMMRLQHSFVNFLGHVNYVDTNENLFGLKAEALRPQAQRQEVKPR